MIRVLFAAFLTMAIAEPPMAQESTFNLGMHATPVVVPELQFTGEDGSTHSLADFRGRYILLNVWATWCAPCREELPTLDTLQRDVGSPVFQVIALSTDTGRRSAVKRLFAELSVASLNPMIDDTGAAMRDLAIFALPTTLLIDGNGREIGRKIGPAKWDSPEAIAFFKNLPSP